MSKCGVGITPFGTKTESFDGVLVKCVNENPDTVPPIGIVTYTKHDIEFVLLVSPYFSGEVPEEVRTLLKEPSDEALLNLLRVDEGSVNHEYLYELASLPQPEASIRIGITHHNPIQYGTERCANRLAPQLLRALMKIEGDKLRFQHVKQSGFDRDGVFGQKTLQQISHSIVIDGLNPICDNLIK